MGVHMTVVELAETKQLNDVVTRLITREGAEFDIPSFFLTFKVGDHIAIEVAPCGESCNNKKSDIVLSGTMYNSTDRFDFFSCGGLLLKLPCSKMKIHDEVTVRMSKSKRRKRE